jgi:hypothetical protein
VLTNWKETLPMKLLKTLLPCQLQHLHTWSVMSAYASRWKEIDSITFCRPVTSTSTKVCNWKVSFSVVD